MNPSSRLLTSADYLQIEALLKHEAPNQWNYITQETIDRQFALLREGRALASLLEDEGIVGFSIMLLGEYCLPSLEKYMALTDITFIQDVVVHNAYAGKGLGTSLLLDAVERAAGLGFKEVFVERHEENLASAGMMRKAGFVEVETFYDPERRNTGSRNTTVMKICTNNCPQ